jgi:tetratricopeptide (TPR) repeat protein
MVVDDDKDDQKRHLARLLNNVATLLHKLGRHEEALRTYQEAVTARMELLKIESSGNESQRDWKDESEQTLLYQASLQGEIALEDSQRNSHRHLDLFQNLRDSEMNVSSLSLPKLSVTDTEAREAAVTLYNMGLLHFEMNSFHKARRLFEMAMESQPDCLTKTMALNCMAQINIVMSQPYEAMVRLNEALCIEQVFLSRSSTQQQHPSSAAHSDELDRCVISTLTMMGRVQHFHGNSKKALRLCREALHIIRMTYSDDSLEVAVMLYNIGLIYQKQGRVCEAVTHMTFFLTKSSGVELSESDEDWAPRIALAYHTCGCLHLENGSKSEAIECLNRALEMRKLIYGLKNVHVAETLTSLGRAYFECGKFDDTLRYLHEAYHIPLQAEYSATVRCHIGHAYYAKDDLDRAMVFYKEALGHALTVMERQSECIMDLLNIIGGLLLEQEGHSSEAIAYITEANEIQAQLALHQQDDNKKYLITPDIIRELQSFHPAAAAA